ncbi:MAG: phosphoenolpyruvate--protein phosphotransferase [Oscillospiraceae bacterium]|nr:phosphoenolpyruvate--protein phosphotransferase [Oscillospiraceae bacterium]
MHIINGVGVSEGVAIGPLRFFDKKRIEIDCEDIDNADEEVARFDKARAVACAQLDELYESAKEKVGEESAAIFDIHRMMLDDMDYIESVIDIIHEQNVNTECAVMQTAEKFRRLFASMDNDYMKERAADVVDVSNRLQDVLNPGLREGFELDTPSIIAAVDISPGEAVQLDNDKVLGFVTAEGSAVTHTAILARSMMIPAVVGVGAKLPAGFNGKPAILDGASGTLYIEPDDVVEAELNAKQNRIRKQREMLERLKGRPSVTLDGTKIDVFANLSHPAALDKAIENAAEGIGLFRSEFLFLESDDFPTEDEQFASYKKVVAGMNGKKVVIRTLDIGADKQVGYFDLPDEANPAMGMRAIRICLSRPEIFKTQLRAIYRASAFGNVAIMFPMIISTGEVEEALRFTEEVMDELRREGVEFDEGVERGIMIETPAAVMIGSELASMVDFFSIGTNDLTQYTLAIDRQNAGLGHLYDAKHPAVMKMIEMAVKAAHDAGIWVGICGELGADMSLTETFLRMGVDELSVSAGMVLLLREKILTLDLRR